MSAESYQVREYELRVYYAVSMDDGRYTESARVLKDRITECYGCNSTANALATAIETAIQYNMDEYYATSINIDLMGWKQLSIIVKKKAEPENKPYIQPVFEIYLTDGIANRLAATATISYNSYWIGFTTNVEE